MVQFKCNGEPASADVPGDVPLLWVLREELGLTGTKFGCGMGLCGACTVHLEGDAVRSCITPCGAVAGKAVKTIEGLSEAGDHPLQQAWAKLNVAQCGYCQPGQLMAAAALLAKTPHPTADDVEAAMTGNLCRCGAYARIKAAILQASRKP